MQMIHVSSLFSDTICNFAMKATPLNLPESYQIHKGAEATSVVTYFAVMQVVHWEFRRLSVSARGSTRSMSLIMVTFGSLRYVLPTLVFDTIFSVIACLFNVC